MNTIFAALLGLPTGKMNYHNIICRLSAPIQFHSKINEQLLGVIRGSVLSPQAHCGWVSRTLTDQPLAVARLRGQQRAAHGQQIPHTTPPERPKSHGSRLWQCCCSGIMETESVRDARVCCQVIIKASLHHTLPGL